MIPIKNSADIFNTVKLFVKYFEFFKPASIAKIRNIVILRANRSGYLANGACAFGQWIICSVIKERILLSNKASKYADHTRALTPRPVNPPTIDENPFKKFLKFDIEIK